MYRDFVYNVYVINTNQMGGNKMKNAIKNEITDKVRGLQNRREFLIKQLEMFETATILNDNGKKVIKDTNEELEGIANEMAKLMEMKEDELVNELAERTEQANKEHQAGLTAKDAVQVNLENMVI